VRIAVSGEAAPASAVTAATHDILAAVAVPVDAHEREVRVTWTGGLAVGHPSAPLAPGQASGGVRVIDFVAADGGWVLTLEGQAGRSYALDLFGETVRTDAAGVTLTPTEQAARTRLDVAFAGERGRVLRVIRFVR
jgi:hypothetical protein